MAYLGITPVLPQTIPVAEVEVFTSSGSWEMPDELVYVVVEVWGAGGGGCGGGGTTGGGGGGGYSKKTIMVNDLNSTEVVTVGLGGAGGANGGNPGGDGGTSSFGSHCSATGGIGGTTQNAASTGDSASLRYSGGIGIDGDLNLRGSSIVANHNAASTPGGAGASAAMGSGGGQGASGDGGHGGVPGGGGAGGRVNGSGGGGAGGNGMVVVTMYKRVV